MNVSEIIKGFGEDGVTLTAPQAKKIKQEFQKLEKTANSYLESLKAEAVKVCSKSFDSLPSEILGEMLDRLEPEHIKAFTNAVIKKEQAEVLLAPLSQENLKAKNDSFVI